LEPKEKARREALRRAKTLDYNCNACGAHAGFPCQKTGRTKTPGAFAQKPHKCRMNRALDYVMVRDYANPSDAAGGTHLKTALAQAAWREFQERCAADAEVEQESSDMLTLTVPLHKFEELHTALLEGSRRLGNVGLTEEDFDRAKMLLDLAKELADAAEVE
jgi:hypothetical protein